MIITLAFGKGGVGKTSTACALANYARGKGEKVLCVDCDPQGNFTYCLNGDLNSPGLYSVIAGQATCADVIQTTGQADLIPSGLLDLAAIEPTMAKDTSLLRKALDPVLGRYDHVIIDTLPSLNGIQYSALCASDGVILPMEADSFSILGLYQMAATIDDVRSHANPELQVLGIVLTKHKPRQRLATDLQDAIEKQAEAMGTKVFQTYVREGVAVKQAQAMKQSIFDYAPRSNPAADYMALCEEIGL